MADCMMFPKDWHDFLKSYSFADKEEVYTNGSELIPVFRVEQLIEHLMAEKQAEIERLCKKIGVMKESIEDAIMSETVFDTFDDLSSYVNAERCRSEEWTGGIRDAIQAVRAWGE